MATTDYCDTADIKAALRIPANDDSDDAAIAAAVDTASRMIDATCGRRFWQDTSTVARTYFPTEPYRVYVDDISTLTGLVVKADTTDDGTYDTTLTINTDFIVAPTNAAAETPVRPWTEIRLLTDAGSLSSFQALSSGRSSVEVTARFGWPAIPDPVKRACVLQAKNVFKAPDLTFGSYQIADEGQPVRIPTVDPLARGMLEPFVRWEPVNG